MPNQFTALTCFACHARKGCRFVRGNRTACRRCVPDPPPVCRDCGEPAGTHRGGGVNLCDGCFARRPKCSHCVTRLIQSGRSHGLCYACSRLPAVRAAHGIAATRTGIVAGSGRLPPAPTTAAPGTPEKFAVLMGRAELGVQLFHPADARFEGDPLPLTALRTG